MTLRSSIALLLTTLLLACGDDDDAGGSAGSNAGTSGTSGTSGTAGSAGTGGSAGAGAAGASGTGGAGASGTSGGSGTSGTSGTAGEAGSSGASGASGTAGTSGSNGASGTGGTSSGDVTSVNPSTSGCFTFATGDSSPNNPCNGDLYFLVGFKVDISSVGQSGLCVQTGSYSTLDSVPSDYAGCSFQSYIEGADGLANTGYIVVDSTATHHYRMQIVSNELPAIQFRYDMID